MIASRNAVMWQFYYLSLLGFDFAMFSIAGGVVDTKVSKQISITLISLLIAFIFSIIKMYQLNLVY